MLLPFEGMGVDTNWELQLPKAANPFDFGSIADVLFTIEYTALQDFSYRRQVIQQLDDRLSAERVISLRDQFADQWYGLHNPLPGDAPLTVDFTLSRSSFPPNIDNCSSCRCCCALAQRRRLHVRDRPDPARADAGRRDGVGRRNRGRHGRQRGEHPARQRRRLGPADREIPVGAWQLTLPDTEDMRGRFRNEEVDDLLLILTYEGRTPEWPM